ncbi:MAG: acyl-CoA synthetase FdrA [Methanopyri archaeon]|jgi:FdrA protein|nr:acyl-CoA synthetase FdrA [Methanopyri archaeon]
MVVRAIIQKNAYRDSVFLMNLSRRLGEMDGIDKAHALMGTPTNIRLLKEDGLLVPELEGAGPNDLLVVVEAASDDVAGAAVKAATSTATAPRDASERAFPSTATALEGSPGANLALISIPGPYVRREAMRVLDEGLNVFLFSDNVSLEDEVALKQRAQDKGLIVMGPGAGTAIVGGTAIAFANSIRPGPVGVVGASGTGIQEITVQLHRRGGGITHAIGTGGRDLYRDVGGISFLSGMDALIADKDTRALVLVSKPAHPEVEAQVLERARAAKAAGKPVVVHFIGGNPAAVEAAGLVPAATLEDAAAAILALLRGKEPSPIIFSAPRDDVMATARKAQEGLTDDQTDIRGLYSGGTLCGEALLVLGPVLGPVRSNATKDPALKMTDPNVSEGNTCVDLGEEEFTQGRPHPMIDHTLRCQRLVQEARDPATVVILLDVVLGYGSSDDPAGALVPTIQEAKSIAAAEGRSLVVVASVCGTDLDPQDLDNQEAALREAGVIVLPSNAQAARMAALIATRGSAEEMIFG